MSNKVLLAVFLAAAGSWFWTNKRQQLFPLDPLYQKPYIVVYGKAACGYCNALRKDLEARNVAYVWKSVEEQAVLLELGPRMKKAGLETSRFNLPVVDVNAELMIRPESAVVLAKRGP